LGEIPCAWKLFRLRFVVDTSVTKKEVRELGPETEVSFVPMEAVGEYGGLMLDGRKPLTAVVDGYTYFRDGDVVVAKITPCFENGKGALAEGLCNGVGFGTTELHVLRPSEHVDKRFLLYLTFSDHFRRIGTASMYGAGGQKRVSDDFIRDFRHPLPCLPEQRAIAAFLDRETTKIDGLVARKQRLIELLQEKRTALITCAVTRGLDPNVPMKDSGVEWLGEIPAHWEINRIKDLSRFVTSGSRGWAEHYSDEGALFLRIGNLRTASVDLDLSDVQRVTPPPGAESERTRVRVGDVLISITALIGAVGVVPEEVVTGFVNQHLALVRISNRQVRPRWLGYCVLSRVGQEQLRAELYGGTKDGLNLDDIRSLTILLPPTDEQDRLTKFLDDAARQIDVLISKIVEAIDRLKEFRTALISTAVTGKIDVREESS
jgi:type I restriction enzyme S subunit